MFKLLRRVTAPLLVLTATGLAPAAPIQAAPVELFADVVRVVSASTSSVTFQVISSYNYEWRLARATKGSAGLYTAPLPKADRKKPVLAKNSVIKLSAHLLPTAVAIFSITRTSGRCQESPAPYSVVLCKLSSQYHARWTGSNYPLPSVPRSVGKCSYSLNLVSPQGAGPGVPLSDAPNGVVFGPVDGASVSLTVGRACKTSSQLGVLGTFTL